MTRVPKDWAERAENALSEAGYRRGGARRAMLDLLDAQSCALSAVEIEDRLRTDVRSVSRVSVYRILEELDLAISSLSRRVPLTVSDREVVLHGACADCEA